jgi:hypothetical protein
MLFDENEFANFIFLLAGGRQRRRFGLRAKITLALFWPSCAAALERARAT